MNQFYEEGHLGGCMVGGDPATYYPKMWEFFLSLLNIKSVFDLGCGEGQSLSFFKDKCRAAGLEGCQSAIDNSIVKDLITLHDFNTGPYDPKENFDLLWCCEVAEHILPQYVDNFLQTIRDTSAKYVFMTHAVPDQGGYHHVNCQSSSYWIHKMNQWGYELSPTYTRMARSIAALENPELYNHFASHGLVFVKQDPWKFFGSKFHDSHRSTHAVITWASGEEFCKHPGIRVFVNSLAACSYNGDKIVFTHDMDIDTREYFAENGFEVVDCDPNEIEWVVRDRFLQWYKFLNRTRYDWVAFLDCKDVVFQQDPFFDFGYLPLEHHVLLIGEGKKHSDCSWNTKDQMGLQNSSKIFKIPFDEWPVICAGTILGKAYVVQNILLQIWSTTLLTNYCTDQAVLNFLYNTALQYDIDILLVDPVNYSVCATADLPKSHPPTFKDGLIYNSKLNRIYSFFHQWDRTQYKELLLEKYS